MNRAPLELAVSLILAVGSAILLLEAWAIRAPANVFPAAILLLVCGLATTSAIRAATKIAQSDELPERLPVDRGRVSLLAGGAVAYAVLLPLGYVPTTAALLFVLYLSFAQSLAFKTIASRAAIAVALTLLAYYGFSELLSVDLPRGGWL